MPKTYLITGGAGFIGSHLAGKLVARGDKVYVIDDLSTGIKTNIPPGAAFLNIDISDDLKLQALKIPERIHCIFHLAAQSSGEISFSDPIRDIEVNYKGTYNVLKLAQNKKCRRFIFSSSMSVYGEPGRRSSFVSENSPSCPASYYGCNKAASENLIRVFSRGAGIDYTIFRLFNVYGPGQNMRNMKQGMVSIYLAYLVNNAPVQVKGSLKRFRDFIYIDDVIETFLKSELSKQTYGEIFNLGTSRKTTVRELLSIILRTYGKTDFKKWIKVKGKTSGDIKGVVADIAKLKEKLGLVPKYGLKDGLARMKEWLDSNPQRRRE